MSNDPRKEASTIEIILVSYDEKFGKIRVTGMARDTEDPAILAIPTMRWDEKARKSVPDEETYAAAIETLTEIGLGSAVQDGEILVEDLGSIEDDLTYEGFYDPDRQFASLSPIKVFIRPQKLDADTAKFLRKKENKVAVFESHPVADWEAGGTYQVLFPMINQNGDHVDLKVSSIVSDDSKVSLRYIDDDLRRHQDKMNEEDISEKRREMLRKSFNVLLASKKERTQKRLHDSLGWDIEKMVEEGQTVKFSLAVQQSNFMGRDTYFLEAELEDDDAEAVNSDLVHADD